MSILGTANKSLVNESWEVMPDGTVDHRYNYIDYRYLAGITYLTVPVLAYVAAKIKKNNLALYGLIETTPGIAAGLFVPAKLDYAKAYDWVSLATIVYLVVRGAENFREGAELIGKQIKMMGVRFGHYYTAASLKRPFPQFKEFVAGFSFQN